MVLLANFNAFSVCHKIKKVKKTTAIWGYTRGTEIFSSSQRPFPGQTQFDLMNWN